ncbi:MAG: hypothetical protein AB1458_13680 [Bacteroidota bacterium]
MGRVREYFMAGLIPNTAVLLGLAFVQNSMGLILVVLALAAGLLKYLRYRKAERILLRRGFSLKLFFAHREAWCSRHMAGMLAAKYGYKGLVKDYYSRLGYRWYHFLPYTGRRERQVWKKLWDYHMQPIKAMYKGCKDVFQQDF